MGLKEEVSEMKTEIKKVQSQSFAMEILSDYKKTNKRLFIIILVILAFWFVTIGYLVWVLNDIGTIETTEEISQSNDNGYNNYIGNDCDIFNGISKDKENK